MTVEVDVVDPRWGAVDLETIAERSVAATLAHLGLLGEWEVAVLACDDERIAELNGDFRARRQATNVLSWPSEERGVRVAGTRPILPDAGGDPELGDIAIAFETCAREAEAAGIPLADHVTHLIVHATLHLLGYDHIREADGDLMEATETDILVGLGVADPYGPRGSG